MMMMMMKGTREERTQRICHAFQSINEFQDQDMFFAEHKLVHFR